MLIAQVSAGTGVIPVKGRYLLEQIQGAYRRLTQPGGIGRVVLTVSTDD